MIWAVIIIGVIVVALVLFEWRSRNKPLSSGLSDTTTNRNLQQLDWSARGTPPFSTPPDLKKPQDGSGR